MSLSLITQRILVEVYSSTDDEETKKILLNRSYFVLKSCSVIWCYKKA